MRAIGCALRRQLSLTKWTAVVASAFSIFGNLIEMFSRLPAVSHNLVIWKDNLDIELLINRKKCRRSK